MSNPNPSPNTRFEKGHKAIGGRPKGSVSLLNILLKKLEVVPEGSKISYAEAVVEALVKKAVVDEDMTAIREIFNRIDGMPKESVEMIGDNNIPLILVKFIETKVNKIDEIKN